MLRVNNVTSQCTSKPDPSPLPPLTFDGLEGVLCAAQRRAELGEDGELRRLPHGPLPQHHLRLQQATGHAPADGRRAPAFPRTLFQPLAAVV